MVAISKTVRKSVKVILDSNSFFVPFQFKIDIFQEMENLLERKIEPILLSPIQKELENIAEKSSPKMHKRAAYALELAKKCTFLEVKKKATETPDDTIVEVAGKMACPVFTNDRNLRKRLRDINVPVIYVRQKAYLEIDGRIKSLV